MRILHMADTHLGYSAYYRVTEEGYNQREVDVYKAFEQAIDIAIREKVDAVVHAGDLFDKPRPNNRAIHVAMKNIARLGDEDIPFIIVSGNHSTPKLRETGSIFRIFEVFDHVYAAYRGKYEVFEVCDAHIHAVPHSFGDQFTRELSKISPRKGLNIAVVHGGFVGFRVFSMNEFGEAIFNSLSYFDGMDYTALGHYHNYSMVSDRIYYSGSTERFSFADAGVDKGVIIVDVESGRTKFVKIDIREMIDLPPIDCKNMLIADLMDAIKEISEREDFSGKIVRLRLKNVQLNVWKNLNISKIRARFSDALHFELLPTILHESIEIETGSASIGPLEEEFESFIKNYPVEGLNKDKMRRMVIEYMRRGEVED